MKIDKVNVGICHRRIQEGKPPFFVNWMEDGKNKYEFFSLIFTCEDLKNRLIKMQEK